MASNAAEYLHSDMILNKTRQAGRSLSLMLAMLKPSSKLMIMASLLCLSFNSAEAQVHSVVHPNSSLVPKPVDKNIRSEEIEEVAEISGMGQVFALLQKTQEAIKSGIHSPAELSDLRQRLIYYRVRLNHLLQRANLHVNSIRGTIDESAAEIDDAHAILMEKRAHTLRRNSMINLVSGGVTKIVGYSIALSPIGDLSTNILEVFDGGVQTGLSGLTLKEDRQERSYTGIMPRLIDTLLKGNNATTSDYPPLIWEFLNRPQPGSANQKSRREHLIEKWTKNDLIGSHARSASNKNSDSGSTTAKSSAVHDLLEDRAAMLSDLKSVVSRMHEELMYLSERIEKSYGDDPQF